MQIGVCSVLWVDIDALLTAYGNQFNSFKNWFQSRKTFEWPVPWQQLQKRLQRVYIPVKRRWEYAWMLAHGTERGHSWLLLIKKLGELSIVSFTWEDLICSGSVCLCGEIRFVCRVRYDMDYGVHTALRLENDRFVQMCNISDSYCFHLESFKLKNNTTHTNIFCHLWYYIWALYFTNITLQRNTFFFYINIYIFYIFLKISNMTY